jgi:hypothetical protein
MEDGAAVPL